MQTPLEPFTVRRTALVVLTAAVLAVLSPALARAEETGQASTQTPTGSATPPPDFISSRGIGERLEASRQELSSVFNLGIRDALIRLDKKVYDATRIRFSGIYTALYQHASGGNGPRDAAGGDFDLIGTWDAVRRGGKTSGWLAAAFEGRHRLGTDIAPAALSTTIDSLWSTTSGFGVQDFSLVQLYWRQNLLGDRLHFRFGKISPYTTFFGNRINSSSLFFVNYAFGDNPAVFFPSNGLGLHVVWDLSPRWTVAGGIQNANAVKTEIDPSTLRHGEFWYALQVQYRAEIRGLGVGTYRLGSWYVAARNGGEDPAGTGGVLSIDQEFGKHFIGFLRYEYQGEALLSPEVQFEALTATKWAVRTGVGIDGPIAALPDDYMGIAGAWGKPNGNSRARNTYVGEIFYRSQIESATQLTLSLQVIQSSTIFDQVFVLSVRFRIEF